MLRSSNVNIQKPGTSPESTLFRFPPDAIHRGIAPETIDDAKTLWNAGANILIFHPDFYVKNAALPSCDDSMAAISVAIAPTTFHSSILTRTNVALS